MRRLNEHIKRAHATVTERTCPYCDKVFADTLSVPRHLPRCPKRPEVTVTCILPPSTVSASPFTPDAKAKTPKRGFAIVEQYLPSLAAYLQRGGFTHTFPVQRDELASSTITSYVSFIRKFLEAVTLGFTSSDAQCMSFHSFLLIFI